AWLERNELVLGRPVLSTEVGYQFWTAHNPETFSRYPAESMDRSRDVSYAALSPDEKAALSGSELERNDLFMRRGLDYVRQNPAEAFLSGIRKIGAGFSVVMNPNREPLVQAVYFISYTPILLLGLIGMWLTRRGWKEHGIIYLQFLSFI